MSPRTTSMLRVGVDEAGLGPTLGPMVVGAFATRSLDADLRTVLVEAIGDPGTKAPRIEVGDSKKIYSGTRKLARLERTVLATLLWTHGKVPRSVAELMELACAPTPHPESDHCAPWYSDLEEALPIAASLDEVIGAGELLVATASSRGVEAPHYRADVISASRINRELTQEAARPSGSKNTWATHAVLRCAASIRIQYGEVPLHIQCDKAGGRMSYADSLVRALPDHVPAVLEERRERSHYRLDRGPSAADSTPALEVAFLMRGDQLDPRISWASCLAKYCRELIMRAFNRYWCRRVDGLRPTAGYPEDARRFIAEAEDLAERLGFEPREWIRSK